MDYVGWCVKCRTKQLMVNVEVFTAKNGRNIAKGTCQKCGTKMSRILKKE